jgi:hypothetical protein
LRDGTTYDVVKVFWNADELVARLAALGWVANIRRADVSTLVGQCRCAWGAAHP